MPPRHAPPRGARRLRQRIAQEAARLISEHGIRDFQLAKRKAAERLHARAESDLPDNREIDQALREHQRLFQADTQPVHLRQLRETACAAMRFFAPFEPRLVGAVLDGSADAHSAICLHLFNDIPEQVIDLLYLNNINYTEHSRHLQHAVNAEFPVLRIVREDATFDLTVLPFDLIRQAPLDRVDARPMQRMGLAALETLLAEEQGT